MTLLQLVHGKFQILVFGPIASRQTATDVIMADQSTSFRQKRRQCVLSVNVALSPQDQRHRHRPEHCVHGVVDLLLRTVVMLPCYELLPYVVVSGTQTLSWAVQ